MECGRFWGMKRTHGPGFRISEELWTKVEPLLPPHVNTHRYGGGRPPASARRCLDGIFFVLRTGCQWKALDATGLCPGSTAHDRFQRWVRAGFFRRLWQAALTDYDELKGLDWSWLSADGCQTKAPLAGEKKRPQPHRPGQARNQAQPAGRGGGCAGGRGGGRSQPQRS